MKRNSITRNRKNNPRGYRNRWCSYHARLSLIRGWYCFILQPDFITITVQGRKVWYTVCRSRVSVPKLTQATEDLYVSTGSRPPEPLWPGLHTSQNSPHYTGAGHGWNRCNGDYFWFLGQIYVHTSCYLSLHPLQYSRDKLGVSLRFRFFLAQCKSLLALVPCALVTFRFGNMLAPQLTVPFLVIRRTPNKS